MSPAFFAGSQEGFCHPLHHFKPTTATLALILVDRHILRSTSRISGYTFGGFSGINLRPPLIAHWAGCVSMLTTAQGPLQISQPLFEAFIVAVDDVEKLTLQPHGERPRFAGANGALIHFTHGSDLGGRASEEYFLGDIQLIP
jgi:hypothetical protein